VVNASLTLDVAAFAALVEAPGAYVPLIDVVEEAARATGVAFVMAVPPVVARPKVGVAPLAGVTVEVTVTFVAPFPVF
jgi:hypothetical protein